MRIGFWKVSAVLVGALALGSLSRGSLLGSSVQAAPQDVRGSSRVAVSSYRTKSGRYVLWADGHITDAQTSAAKGTYDPNPIPGFTDPHPGTGGPKGSPNVAIGIVPLPSATYILFSNGNVRKPSDPGAAAGTQSSVRWGTVSASGAVMSGSGDFRVVSGSNPRRIIFDPPFTEVPAVTCTSRGSIDSPMRVVAIPTRDYVDFNFMVNESGDGTSSGNMDFSFIAAGE